MAPPVCVAKYSTTKNNWPYTHTHTHTHTHNMELWSLPAYMLVSLKIIVILLTSFSPRIERTNVQLLDRTWGMDWDWQGIGSGVPANHDYSISSQVIAEEHKLCVMESSTKKMFLFDPCTQNWSLYSQLIIYPHFPRGLGHKKPPWNVDLSRSKFSLDFFVFPTWYHLLYATGSTQSRNRT